jgi:hypothetical protein
VHHEAARPGAHPTAPRLRREIDAYQIDIDRGGKETLGGVGVHDDMVTAPALAWLDDPRTHMVTFGTVRYF